MRTKRIAVLGYDDVQALDIAGPLDAFDMANRGTHADRPNYQTLCWASQPELSLGGWHQFQTKRGD
jgi:hypothetical protein